MQVGGMDGGRECWHRDYIRLLDIGEQHKQLLVHRATGEAVEVLVRSSLAFDDEDGGGFAFLMPLCEEDQDCIWANDLLDKSVHIFAGDGGDGQVEVISSKSAGSRTFRADASQRMQSSPMVIRHSKGTLTMECYEHEVPKRFVWVRKFWVLARLQDFVFGPASGCKWICKNYLRMVESVRLCLSLC